MMIRNTAVPTFGKIYIGDDKLPEKSKVYRPKNFILWNNRTQMLTEAKNRDGILKVYPDSLFTPVYLDNIKDNALDYFAEEVKQDGWQKAMVWLKAQLVNPDSRFTIEKPGKTKTFTS